MHTILVILHILIAIALILTVLLQTGKGASMGAAFGGGGSSTVFGSRGPASFLGKFTAFVAIAFMLTCIGLNLIAERNLTSDSIMNDAVPATQETQAETKPAEEPTPTANVPTEQAQPIQSNDGGNK